MDTKNKSYWFLITVNRNWLHVFYRMLAAQWNIGYESLKEHKHFVIDFKKETINPLSVYEYNKAKKKTDCFKKCLFMIEKADIGCVKERIYDIMNPLNKRL